MNGHINETAPPLVSIGEVKLVQVQIVVWFVRTCEVWILFVLHFIWCDVNCLFVNIILDKWRGLFFKKKSTCETEARSEEEGDG